MREHQLDSAAFRNAELHSELLRIIGVLGFVSIFIVVTIVRVFIIRTASDTASWIWSFLLAAIIATYEGWMFRKVDLALKEDRRLPARFWILSTIVETSIPAFAVAFLTSSEIEVEYRAVASPPILIFFIFIILSTLRLSPWIGVLSGSVASGSYLCAALYLGW